MIKHVVSGNGAPFAPSSIDIGTFILVSHKLAVAVHAPIRRKNPGALLGRTRIPLGCNGASVGILVGLHAGESDVRIGYKGQP